MGFENLGGQNEVPNLNETAIKIADALRLHETSIEVEENSEDAYGAQEAA